MFKLYNENGLGGTSISLWRILSSSENKNRKIANAKCEPEPLGVRFLNMDLEGIEPSLLI